MPPFGHTAVVVLAPGRTLDYLEGTSPYLPASKTIPDPSALVLLAPKLFQHLSRGVGAQNVIGTIYHSLGIDPKQQLNHFTGRPTQLLDDGEPLAELVG
jgi:hypothetical protein